MKCWCGANTRVLATRDTERRRVCTLDHRTTTVEVPAGLLKAIGRVRVQTLTAAINRGARRTAESTERRHRIEQLLAAGWKPTAIAHEVGVSDSFVCQVRRDL